MKVLRHRRNWVSFLLRIFGRGKKERKAGNWEDCRTFTGSVRVVSLRGAGLDPIERCAARGTWEGRGKGASGEPARGEGPAIFNRMLLQNLRFGGTKGKHGLLIHCQSDPNLTSSPLPERWIRSSSLVLTGRPRTKKMGGGRGDGCSRISKISRYLKASRL